MGSCNTAVLLPIVDNHETDARNCFVVCPPPHVHPCPLSGLLSLPSPRPLTPSDKIIFSPGVVELSILFGIHEDGEVETDEYFDLFLHAPWGGARLGSQKRTRVTVKDAESDGAVSHHATSALHFDPIGGGDTSSQSYDESRDGVETPNPHDDDGDDASGIVVEAGTVQNGTLVAKDAMGGLRGFGGEVFTAWVEVREAGFDGEGTDSSVGNLTSSYSVSAVGAPSAAAAATAVTRVEDLGSGNYTISYQVGQRCWNSSSS